MTGWLMQDLYPARSLLHTGLGRAELRTHVGMSRRVAETWPCNLGQNLPQARIDTSGQTEPSGPAATDSLEPLEEISRSPPGHVQ